MIKLGIIGATGYVGSELIRILQNHQYIDIVHISSQNNSDLNISDLYPNLKKIFEKKINPIDVEKITDVCDIIITALPHGLSKNIIPAALKKGKKVIDHSADFRYKDSEIYRKVYGLKHETPELLKYSVYGLPELYREEIKTAKIVANPGCYPTCSILALAPLLKNKIIYTNNIIINAVSGVTGAGRNTSLQYQFCECDGNFKPYNPINHRHRSEIEQELSLLASENISIAFVPHLAPFKRGMMCTIYCDLAERFTTSNFYDLYNEFYSNDTFVRILNDNKLPEIKHVVGSNFIDISAAIDEKLNKITIFSCQDNLIKGAAGQAIQNLNIMIGIDETTALKSPGIYF